MEQQESKRYFVGGVDVFLLGIAIVLGGQVFSWNTILLSGIWEAFLSMMLTASGYICLVLCSSEMTSALPFSGNCLLSLLLSFDLTII
jgi:amino acid transporter